LDDLVRHMTRLISTRVLALLVLALLLAASISLRVGSTEGSGAPLDRPIGWWDDWLWDKDHDGVDDRLEDVMLRSPGQERTVLVAYSRPTTADDVAGLERLGLTIHYRAKFIDTIIVRGAAPWAISQILRLPGVGVVEYDEPMRPVMDVAARGVQARGSSTYAGSVWDDLGVDGRNATVAILDTGVDDLIHQGVQGKFVGGADFSGTVFLLNTNPDDTNGHGSHCAGIAIGSGEALDNDGDGEWDYMGMAHNASLVDVKVFNAVGGTTPSKTIPAFEWCIEHKDEYNIRVASCSFGGSYNSDGKDSECQSINSLVDAGIVAVVATGNDGQRVIPNPAAADKVIAVGALNDRDTVSRNDDYVDSYSNYGPRDSDGDADQLDELKPDVVAPGTSIYSIQANTFSAYVSQSGTSMATPAVAGVAALILDANPQLTPGEVKDIIRRSADQRWSPSAPASDPDWNNKAGWGMVNAYVAVSLALDPYPPNVTIDSPTQDQTVSGQKMISGSTSDQGSGVEYVEVRVNGGAWQTANDVNPWYIMWDFTGVVDGLRSVEARAWDGYSYGLADIVWVEVENFGDYSLPLVEGWNLVSVPYMLENNSREAFLSSLGGDVVSAQVYRDGEWRWWSTDKEDGDREITFNQVLTRDAVWVNMSAPGTLTVDPSWHLDSVYLNDGWNLACFPSTGEMTVGDALASVAWDHVERWNASAQQFEVLSGGDTLTPGEGYWIHCTGDDWWEP